MSSKSAPQPIGKATRLRKLKLSPYEETEKPRRVAIYVRVSKEEQAEGQSLAEQERRCRAYLAREKPHWSIVGVYEDQHSGKTATGRGNFRKMLKLVDEGQIDAIVCHHLDRFSRSLHDIMVYFRQFEEQGVVLAFAEDRFDFSTPEGILQFHVLAVFADWYIQNLAREVRKGKLGRVLKGEHNNQVPFGYVRNEQGKLEIVPEEGEALREAFERYASGVATDRQIAEMFTQRGLRTRSGKIWSKDGVRDLLQNDFYYGVVEYRTDLYPGNHPPLISKELFDQALAMRHKRRPAPRTYSATLRTYLLNGIAYCATCGRSLRAQGSRNYQYYREVSHLRGYDDCPHAGEGVQSHVIEDQVAKVFQAFQLPEDWQKELRLALSNEDERKQIQVQRRSLEAQKTRYVEMYAAGDITREQYDQHRNTIMQELNRLVVPSPDRALNVGDQVDGFRHVWPLATPEERREICRLMLERVDVDLGTKQITRMYPHEDFVWFFQHNPLLEYEDGATFRVRPEVVVTGE